jgi:hypothetical protein
MIVLHQPVEEFAARARADDIGQAMGEALMPFVTRIIVHFHAILVEDGLRLPAVFEAMKVDLDTRIEKGADLMEQIENTAVIHGVWHVQAHDM